MLDASKKKMEFVLRRAQKQNVDAPGIEPGTFHRRRIVVNAKRKSYH